MLNERQSAEFGKYPLSMEGHLREGHEMAKRALDATMERKTSAVEIIDLGRLSDIQWPGGVSADRMLEDGEITPELMEAAVERINEFYVSVNRTAKTRCIDGRHDPELDEMNLGPQVPGGAPGAALAYRLGVDRDDLTRGTFLADAESMMGTFRRLGFSPGGHRDEKSSGQVNVVGCGAIDGMDSVLSAMTNPLLVDDHKRVVKSLLGGNFVRTNYLQVLGAGLVVQGRSEEYFKGREGIIDILENKFQKSVSTLKGSHKEFIWVVNMVPNTTLSSNRFSEEFGGGQAFGYDIWRSLQMAEKVLPRADQAEDRHKFVMARVMSTVATLMALTDGSQRLLLRMPK